MGVEATYLTIPTNEAPRGCNQITLLDKNLLQTLESYSVSYLAYGVLSFWVRSYYYLRSHADEYDVIWFHNPRLLPLTPPDIRDKLLITFHNRLLKRKATYYDSVVRFYYRLFGAIEHRGIASLSDARFTVVYDDIATEIKHCGVQSNRVRYIGNGVNLDRFTPSRGTQVHAHLDLPSGPLMLSLGRLAPQKQPLALLDTFEKIRDRRDEISLAIAGDGPMRDRAERFVEQHDIDGVHFLGFVEEDIKPNLYAGSDFFVLPSAYEGEPLALYEALASGLPCIVSDIPNLQFVNRAGCGLTTDFEDPNTAAADIISYLDLSRDYSTAAREYAEKNLDWGAKADAYLEELESVHSGTDESENG